MNAEWQSEKSSVRLSRRDLLRGAVILTTATLAQMLPAHVERPLQGSGLGKDLKIPLSSATNLQSASFLRAVVENGPVNEAPASISGLRKYTCKGSNCLLESPLRGHTEQLLSNIQTAAAQSIKSRVAYAQSGFYMADRVPWFNPQYFPAKEGLVVNGIFQMTLHEDGGPAHVHDEFIRHELQQPAYSREYIAWRDQTLLSTPRDIPQDALGHCHAAWGNVPIHKPEPPGNADYFLDGRLRVDKTIRHGLLTMDHAGDIADRPTFGSGENVQYNIEHSIDQLIAFGRTFVVEHPKGWYQAVYGVSFDRQSLLVNRPPGVVPRSEVLFAHYPVQLWEIEAGLVSVDPYLIAETSDWRYTSISRRQYPNRASWMDYSDAKPNVIGHLVYRHEL